MVTLDNTPMYRPRISHFALIVHPKGHDSVGMIVAIFIGVETTVISASGTYKQGIDRTGWYTVCLLLTQVWRLEIN